VALPLLAAIPAGRRWLDRLGVLAPSARLIPAFAATLLLYQLYPWSFSGELVELMLGLGILFGALQTHGLLDWRLPAVGGAGSRSVIVIGLAGALVGGLGHAGAAFSRAQREASPGAVEAARTEVGALKRDVQVMGWRAGGEPVTDCGMHKRVYSWVQKYGHAELHEGNFARLVDRGLPEERAQFFIDPWNSPYWIRHECSQGRRRQVVFVYSLGPNRRRESGDWEVRGDDVGAVILSTDP
jgi:hypothetical protein